MVCGLVKVQKKAENLNLLSGYRSRVVPVIGPLYQISKFDEVTLCVESA